MNRDQQTLPSTRRLLASLVRETAREWKRHHIPRLSAALSFYALFSLSPLVVLMLTISGTWLGADRARTELSAQMDAALGSTAADAVGEWVAVSQPAPASMVAAVASTVFLLFGATRLFGELKDALNIIWGVEVPQGRAFRSWSRKRLLSIVMVAGLVFLLLLSSVFSVAVAAGAGLAERWISIPPLVWSAAGLGLGLLLETALFALMFSILPDLKVPPRDVWLGAAITAVCFEVGKLALAWYLSRDSATLAGSAGSVMSVLLWVYYTSIIVLSGAEFTHVHSRWRQSRAAA